MKIKLDENLPEALLAALSELNHAVDNVRQEDWLDRMTRTSGRRLRTKAGF
jgi:hypothetical protein